MSWQVVDERLADDHGEPYLDLIAERDYSELRTRRAARARAGARARAQEARRGAARAPPRRGGGPGRRAGRARGGRGARLGRGRGATSTRWSSRRSRTTCSSSAASTRPRRRETWLDTVKARLRATWSDSGTTSRADHDQIEEWEFRDGRIFAAVGSIEDEADPDRGHGWMPGWSTRARWAPQASAGSARPSSRSRRPIRAPC